ncbi:hypothetical protein KY290_036511 [Solanum tuberosum]|uniref:Uncharacterized protein n=1 Tax=Solanum tuberosum TaxID=4113 RepID=A0ABQ7TUI2_SOLTU|nr:hypothetical protein KY289_036010 [Solanum tuberosum]KAH0639233.1 hypothetical protein KY285_035819 [Solanum tuberosum]KAH0737806.1 hypothetical protein KY290_036511 [Solanum tuberosum]
MALTIVTLQFHYGGCFVTDPTVRVNKKGGYYMVNTDFDVLNFLNGLKGADFVYVYVVYPISISLVVEEILILPSTNVDVSSSLQKDNADVSSSRHKNRANLSSSPQIDRVDLSSSPQIDRADVSSSQPFDENKNKHLNQNQSPIVEEQSPRVEEQALRVEEHSDSDSLYDVDENIDDLSNLDEELLQARQSNIQEQVKDKADRVNPDEIPSGPVYPNSDISEDEGDNVENDEVVDPVPRKETTKIYFDPTAKKTFGHNKKGCPTLKNAGTSNIGTSVATARTNVVTVGTSAAVAGTNAATSDFTNAAIGSQSSVNAGPSAATASTLAGRPTNVSSSGVRHATTSTICGRPTNASSSGVRAAAASTFGVRPTTTPLRTQLLVVLHSATLSSSTPTNIDLGYKPNGLRWKGRVAVTQRQLRDEQPTPLMHHLYVF